MPSSGLAKSRAHLLGWVLLSALIGGLLPMTARQAWAGMTQNRDCRQIFQLFLKGTRDFESWAEF